MTPREACIKFCRSSATMAEVAREYGVDEETMRDIVCAQCSPRADAKASKVFDEQVKKARAAYIARGMEKTLFATLAERKLAITLHFDTGLPAAAIARGFDRNADTVRKWIDDYKGKRPKEARLR